MKEQKEKREYLRLKKLLPVEFTLGESVASYDKVILLFYSINISGGGVMVISNISLKEGSKLSIGFDLDGEKLSDLSSEIVWTRPARIDGLYELGIKFTDISEEDRKKILDFVKKES